jgi:threonine/homoserine/homoserine lactone efflux protein
MEVPDSGLLVFLGFVVLVSLSGVMMPGPVLAATITKGLNNRHAGIWIALAHGVVEFPLIAGLYLGLGGLFENVTVMSVIGLVGGAMLIYMGTDMIRKRRAGPEDAEPLPYHPFWVGIITSLSNPYFFLWWATVGILLITTASSFGAWAVAVFAITHWSCDLVWDAFVGYAAFRSRDIWNERVGSAILGICGIVLIWFGAYFMTTPLLA